MVFNLLAFALVVLAPAIELRTDERFGLGGASQARHRQRGGGLEECSAGDLHGASVAEVDGWPKFSKGTPTLAPP
jgi:hypothetical protein